MKDMQGYIRAAGLLKPPPAPQQVLPVDPIFQNVLFTNISILILCLDCGHLSAALKLW